ncbi:MAG: hypothetical protein H6707_03565 [Deltaproteobacteria bacterium]|nr:hypothetical protein [Deltaproteobacteria bacterium]
MTRILVSRIALVFALSALGAWGCGQLAADGSVVVDGKAGYVEAPHTDRYQVGIEDSRSQYASAGRYEGPWQRIACMRSAGLPIFPQGVVPAVAPLYLSLAEDFVTDGLKDGKGMPVNLHNAALRGVVAGLLARQLVLDDPLTARSNGAPADWAILGPNEQTIDSLFLALTDPADGYSVPPSTFERANEMTEQRCPSCVASTAKKEDGLAALTRRLAAERQAGGSVEISELPSGLRSRALGEHPVTYYIRRRLVRHVRAFDLYAFCVGDATNEECARADLFGGLLLASYATVEYDIDGIRPAAESSCVDGQIVTTHYELSLAVGREASGGQSIRATVKAASAAPDAAATLKLYLQRPNQLEPDCRTLADGEQVLRFDQQRTPSAVFAVSARDDGDYLAHALLCSGDGRLLTSARQAVVVCGRSRRDSECIDSFTPPTSPGCQLGNQPAGALPMVIVIVIFARCRRRKLVGAA